jgi:hypothetical protein
MAYESYLTFIATASAGERQKVTALTAMVAGQDL